MDDNRRPGSFECSDVQGRPVDYIVSAVMVKPIPAGVNTQNKLYAINASSQDEAHGRVLSMVKSDFPEHQLHTICSFPVVYPSPAVAVDWEALRNFWTNRSSFTLDELETTLGAVIKEVPAVEVSEQLLTALKLAQFFVEEITNAAGKYAGLEGNVVADAYLVSAKLNMAIATAKAAPVVEVSDQDSSECFNAAIDYALKCGTGDDGLEFLACWREGNFDAIRKEWPDAPSAVFKGAEASKGGV
ncbi:MAG TPA: hypothetical protein VFV43_11975 [Limnobacter sp.]|nr:hypothetical protein [Limnobacter sp.]